ncbi:MAG: hypothetical protein KF774_14010 [Planctomyces sp.]|nr:hypothetical protein [Planctomyces sp.]
MRRILVALTLSAAVIAASAESVRACPFCAAPEQTLAEQLSQADAAVLAQWSAGTPADREKESFGETSYEVVEVLRQPSGELEKGEAVVLDRFRPGRPGDLFLLLGTKSSGAINWSSPMEVTETAYNYVRQAPGKEQPTVKRLSYFLKFLESPDELIARDAYSEFAGAPYQDIAPLADEFSAEKLRGWITNPQTTPTRLGFYGLMLGLCGQAEDAEFLKGEVLKPVDGYRLGIDGMMAGYLLLTGDEGVAVLEEAKLRDTTVPFSETYAAMQALRFMWQYAGDRIPKPRLRSAMRSLLERPEVADLVITDLGRWEDWEVMERLKTMYDAPEFSNSQTKRAIVRYMLLLSKKKPTSEDAAPDLAATIGRAKSFVEELRERDPATVKQAERFFFLN